MHLKQKHVEPPRGSSEAVDERQVAVRAGIAPQKHAVAQVFVHNHGARRRYRRQGEREQRASELLLREEQPVLDDEVGGAPEIGHLVLEYAALEGEAAMENLQECRAH